MNMAQTPQPHMNMAVRVISSAAAAFLAFFLATVFLPFVTSLPDTASLIIGLGLGLFAGWIVWRALSGQSPGLLPAVVTGAAVVGGGGFIIGFLGPILLFPEANQGPLLGIFITGPAGVVVGALAGLVWWLKKGRH